MVDALELVEQLQTIVMDKAEYDIFLIALQRKNC